MRKILPLALLLLALVGCKRPAVTVTTNPQPQPAPAPAPAGPNNQQTTAHAPTGVVINPGTGGGGSGGAAQAVRKAATRAVSQNELNQVRIFIESYSSASGQMPSREQIAAALQKEAPAIYKLWQDKVIMVTGAKQRESIWAYTTDPQSTTGEHLAATHEGVVRMTPQVLKQRLQGQGT